jgi:hypothetical protein
MLMTPHDVAEAPSNAVPDDCAADPLGRDKAGAKRRLVIEFEQA